MQDFVPYTEALSLKELGFNETNFECFKHWVHYGDYNYFLIIPKPKNSYDYIEAPLYQQAFRWLYQKLDIEKGVMPLDIESQQLLLKELIDKVSSKHLLV